MKIRSLVFVFILFVFFAGLSFAAGKTEIASKNPQSQQAGLKEEAIPKKMSDKDKKKIQKAGKRQSLLLKEEVVLGERINPGDGRSLRMAIEDIRDTFGDAYPSAGEYLKQLDTIEQRRQSGEDVYDDFISLQRKALLANPVIDFDKILLVKRRLIDSRTKYWARKVSNNRAGLPKINSETNVSIARKGWDNEIAVLSDFRGEGKFRTLYKAPGSAIAKDVELNFDADRIMFSSIGTHDRWHVFEMAADGSDVRQLTPKDLPDIEHFDSCYLPDGRIIYTSTAVYQGLPCIGGGQPMAVLFRMDADGGNITQLTHEQDSDWTPAILNDGKVMYLRWEYTDTPHYFTRILFSCNPDGTEQKEYYGSNSYFPNSFFFARAIPGHPSKVVGIAGGHHGIPRSGRILILDPAIGRREADGVVQEIPGYGKKVEPIIKDRLVAGIWPRFINPYPLSEKYFLVTAKPTKHALWGIYLVDTFDNMTLVKELEDHALFEPVPFKKTYRPPFIPDKVVPGDKNATMYVADVYAGPGLDGMPKDKVKSLRLFSYHYNYHKSGGHASVGMEASWDIKRVLGTVPVEDDGSVMFTFPANTPISMQPLDDQGRAVQLMRSWVVGKPGEVVSCIGCHEGQNMVPPAKRTIASRKVPVDIKPWHGKARPFAFRFEVQPVLDKYCVSCHSGTEGRPNFKSAKGAADDYRKDIAYMSLHPYVRRPGPESDYHLLQPMEYHASTSELIQTLKKGHYGVKLDDQAWDRLYTWIDLNVPYRGKWSPSKQLIGDQVRRRIELAKKYANVDTDPEKEYDDTAEAYAARDAVRPVIPVRPKVVKSKAPKVKGWPMDADTARDLQREQGSVTWRKVDLGGSSMEMMLIPAGEFVMGSTEGADDELPLTKVRVKKPFWMATLEITNAQYKLFDPTHDSRFIDQQWKDHTTPGYPANMPNQPVIRISWEQATAFCKWLSEKTGENFTLPTEAQWEYASRAGSDTPFWYGDLDSDFGSFANLSDVNMSKFAVKGVNPKPVESGGRDPGNMAFIPRIKSVDDKQMTVADVGLYKPNPWGLYDMQGNVAEWTRSTYMPYPHSITGMQAKGKKVARGGSWRDRPKRATSSYRLAYEPYQRVFNVGFRVIVEAK